MERFGIDASAAFAMLVHSSQETNMRVADVTRWLAIGRVPAPTTDGVAYRLP